MVGSFYIDSKYALNYFTGYYNKETINDPGNMIYLL